MNPDPAQSHYGFPQQDLADMNEFVRNLPNADNVEIYGFSQAIERVVMGSKAADLLKMLGILNETKKVKSLGYVGLQQDIDGVLSKISLAKTNMSLHLTSSEKLLEESPDKQHH